MLVYNFEAVDYDYSLPTDKMPPRVQYSKYSDAPIRPQLYPYIRAQRMCKAGATNEKILHPQQKPSEQTSHSAKSLSAHSLLRAKRIQSAVSSRYATENLNKRLGTTGSAPGRLQSKSMMDLSSKSSSSGSIRPTTAKSRRVSAHSTAVPATPGTAVTSVKIVAPALQDSDATTEEDAEMKRRVSWAFEHPFVPTVNFMNLQETKSLLRSQIRAKGETIPPDFVYLTVNAIQQSMKPSQVTSNTASNKKFEELQIKKKLGRPSSSPSRIDPRTKVPVEELTWNQFLAEQGFAATDIDARSEAESKVSQVTNGSHYATVPVTLGVPTTTTILTEFGPVPIEAKPHLSMYSKHVQSSIPPPRLLRPHTATMIKSNLVYGQPRPHSAATCLPETTVQSRLRSAVSRDSRKSMATPSTSNAEMAPMLMYPQQLHDRIAQMKQRRIERQAEQQQVRKVGDQTIGNVSKFNDPLRSHVDFKLKTHHQVEQEMKEMNNRYIDDKVRQSSRQEKRQKAAWKAKVTGKTRMDFAQKPKSVAPELGEYEAVH